MLGQCVGIQYRPRSGKEPVFLFRHFLPFASSDFARFLCVGAGMVPVALSAEFPENGCPDRPFSPTSHGCTGSEEHFDDLGMATASRPGHWCGPGLVVREVCRRPPRQQQVDHVG